MAQPPFGVSGALTPTLWSKRALQDSIADDTLVGQMKKDGSLKVVQDTSREAGQTVRVGFRQRFTGPGIVGSATVTGLEEDLDYFYDDVIINQLDKVGKKPASGSIGAQQTSFDLDNDLYTGLMEWQIEMQTLAVVNQLAGNTASSITWDGYTFSTTNELAQIRGFNTATAPSSGKIVRPNSLTTDQAVNADSTATFKLNLIQEAEKIAMKNRPYINPLVGLGNGIKYRCYVHVDQFYDIINDTTAPHQYRDIIQSQIAGGGKKEALIGKSIEFSQTEIICTDKIPYGVHSSTSAEQTNVRRAIFVGRDAGAVAYGKGYGSGKMAIAGFGFYKDQTDVGKIDRYRCASIAGVTKAVFNSIDHGVVVIPTYVA